MKGSEGLKHESYLTMYKCSKNTKDSRGKLYVKQSLGVNASNPNNEVQ